MRYYTKEWHKLMQFIGTTDLYEPVIDKEYSDAEIENLYQIMLDKNIQEERDAYDEPPVFDLDEWKEDFPEEDFDPEDFLIEEYDEDGDVIGLRNPETYEELVAFQMAEYEREWKEYEEREPFDEEDAAELFEEDYKEKLAEPDEDLPDWVLESVDHRLIAMGVLPEGAYKRLMAEEAEAQERFDEIDAEADDALEVMYAQLPDECGTLLEDLDDMDGDYVLDADRVKNEMVLTLAGWDEDGEDVRRQIIMEDIEILEDEGLSIEAETDEDGDTVSNCDLLYHEVYFEDGMFEVHFMFDNEGLKYLTLRCSSITLTQESPE